MALIEANSFNGSGPTFNLFNGDDFFIRADDFILNSNTSAPALWAVDSDHHVFVEGTLISGDVAIMLGDSLNDTGNSVTIYATGSVSSAENAIQCEGSVSIISNAGRIVGGFNGINLTTSSGDPSYVINSGLIMAPFQAIYASGIGGVTVLNTGSLVSTRNGYSYFGGAGVDTITNKGAMKGNIYLGINNDRYDGTGGSVVGDVSGGAGNDTLISGGLADTLRGDTDHDKLWGRGGKDTLTGGTGMDKFYFDTAPNSSTNRDTITDFVVADDTIYLRKSVFAAIGQTTLNVALQAQYFWEAADGKAHDANDRIIYNTSNGVLSYDPDGTAGSAAIQQIAVVLNNGVDLNTALTNADFFLY